MEKAQLCKSAYDKQLQQSIYLCYKRKIPTNCVPSTPYEIQEIAQIRF